MFHLYIIQDLLYYKNCNIRLNSFSNLKYQHQEAEGSVVNIFISQTVNMARKLGIYFFLLFSLHVAGKTASICTIDNI